MNIKYVFFSAMFAFAVQGCLAQTTTPDILSAAGGNAINKSCSLCWSLGELITETGASSNSYLTQGFQQLNDITIMSAGNENNPSGNSIYAYPNPATGLVYIYNSANQPLRVEVMTLTGETLFSKNLSGNAQNEINLDEYSSGIYLFKVYSMNGQNLQTLKIDKIK